MAKKKIEPRKKIKKSIKRKEEFDIKSTQKSFWNSDLFALIIIGLSVVFFFHEQIFGIASFWSNYWADWTEVTAPLFKYNIEALQNGHMPFWNPYAYGGTIHLAEPTSIFFCPLTFILSYLLSPEDNILEILSWIIIVFFYILAINTYFFAKYFKVSFWARIMAAVAFTFSSSSVYEWVYINSLSGFIWLPLVLLFIFKLLEQKENRLKNSIYAGILLSLSLGGHPQEYFYTLAFIAIIVLSYKLFLCYKVKKEKVVESLIDGLPYLILAGVLGLILISVQLLMLIEAIPYTTRSDISYDFATDGSFQFRQLLTFLSPKVFGIFRAGFPVDFVHYFATPGKSYHYWETVHFFGVVPLVLGLWGFYLKRKTILFKALFVGCIIFFLHALGSNTPFYKIFYNLPGFSSFRIPSRTLPYIVLLLCISSAIGLDRILSKKPLLKNEKVSLWIIVGLAVVGSLYLLTLFGDVYDIPAEWRSTLTKFALISLLLSLSIIPLFFFGKKAVVPSSVIMVLLVMVDLSIANKAYKNAPEGEVNSMEVSDQIKTILKPETNDVWRYKPVSRRQRLLKRNDGTFNGIYSMDGFYAFGLVREKTPPNWPSNDLMAVRKSSDVKRDDKGAQRAFFNDITTAHNHHRMTYNFLADADKIANPDNIDFAKTTVLPSIEGIHNSDLNPSDVSHTIAMDNYGGEFIEFKVTTEKAGMLVLAEYWFPHWKAFVDNEEVEVHKANHAFRGVWVPEGEHEVRFQYISKAYIIGKWITIIGWLGVLGFLLFDYLRNRSQAKLA